MDKELEQRYIISKRSLELLREGKKIMIKVENVSKKKANLSKISKIDLSSDASFLPIASEKYSERNAEKWYLINKEKGKETYTYDIWCTRYKWAGRGKAEPYTDWFTIRRERWARDYFNPYEVFFYYDKEKDCIVSDTFIYNEENFNKIKNTINLVLKAFGECIVSDGDDSYFGRIKKENWKFLPKGVWSPDKDTIERVVKRYKKSEKENLVHNLETINNLNPDEIAVGQDGFNGYFAFKFESINLCILESIKPDNATYVFETENWKRLSKLTKTEIIEGSLANQRIFHNKNWESNLKKLFK